MHKKEERFIFNSLDIERIEIDKPSPLRQGVNRSFERIVASSRYPMVLIVLAYIINLLSMLGIVLGYDQGDQWNFSAVKFFHDSLAYLRNVYFTNGQNQTVSTIVLVIIVIHHTLIFLYFGFLCRFLPPTWQDRVCSYLSFFLIILNQAFGVFFLTFFGIQLSCPNFDYSSVCLNGVKILQFALGIYGVLAHVLLTASSVIFLHFTNPAIPFDLNGSSKLYLGVLELERLAYSLYFVIRQNTSADKQFLIFMSLAALVKIYEKIQSGPFYNTRVNSWVVSIASFLEVFVPEVCLITFLEVNTTNPISFVITILNSLIYGYCFQDFLEQRFFRSLELVAKTHEKLEGELMEYSNLFIAAIINVPNGMEYRKILENLVYVHRLKCNVSSCPCSDFKCYDFKRFKADRIQRDCYRFWNAKLREYLGTFGSNAQFLLQSMFISVYHTSEVFSVMANYKRADGVKKEISRVIELNLVRSILEQKIIDDNFEFVKQCERINYQKFRENHLQSVEVMAEMEQLLKALFSFWEDITVVPQKFEKNYEVLFTICRRILLMKERLEKFCVEYLNTKLIKTFVAFAEMVGFPEHEVKRAFYKIIMNHENGLEKNFVSVRIRNTVINSRKTAVVVASAVRESMGEVLYASSLVQEVISHHASDLRGKNIKSLMPLCYAQIHDKMMETYLDKQDSQKLKSRNLLSFVKDKDGFLNRVGVFIKTYPYCDTHLKMVD